MTTDLLGPGGEQISPDSIRARLSAEAQAAADRIINRHTSELATYDLEAVRELGKHAI